MVYPFVLKCFFFLQLIIKCLQKVLLGTMLLTGAMKYWLKREGFLGSLGKEVVVGLVSWFLSCGFVL